MWALIGRYFLKKLMKKKIFWVLLFAVPITIFIMTNAIYFFIFNMLVNQVEAEAAASAEKTKSVIEMYRDDFEEESKEGEPEVSEKPEIQNPVKDPAYDDTKGNAETITGTSLLHEIHNAIVNITNNTGVAGYTYAYVLGSNYTESGGSGSPWIPWTSAPLQATKEQGFSLKDWSYADAVKWKEKTGFDLKSYRRYIGAFQIDYNDWNSSLGTPSKSWGLTEWGKFVNGAHTNRDGSGDGKADPHNYYDALKANSDHARSKSQAMSKGLSLLSSEGEEDMRTMMIASRYIGTTGRDGSRQTSGHTYKTYPYVEGYNPHIDLMRAAYNEYKSNGKHYSQMKSIMEGQNSTSANGTEIAKVIDSFYLANGWTKVGIGYKKAYPDGNGFIVIRGPGTNSAQDVYYPFRVFWGGKIGEENIKRILSSN